ncbi:MAG: hypothetical protein R2932_43705 [Caldilineaceae bacterium]
MAYHTSYGLVWRWTIAGATLEPTPLVTPTVAITATPTMTVTPAVSATRAVTVTPTIVATAPTTPTPEGTATATATPTATPTATAETTPLPFVATLVDCGPSNNGMRVEGHVYVDGQLADGYRITYSYPGAETPVPAQPAISGNWFRPGFYDFVLQSGIWTTWMVDADGKPLSNVVTYQVDSQAGACQVATVDFHKAVE